MKITKTVKKPEDNGIAAGFLVEDYHFVVGPETVSSFAQPLFVRIGVDDAEQVHQYKNHQHHDYEIIMVERGRYSCLLNKRQIDLDPGGILIVKPGDWHHDYCLPPVRYYHLVFILRGQSTGAVEQRLFKEMVKERMQVARDESGELLALVRSICESMQDEGIIDLYISQARMTELFWRIIRQLPQDALADDFPAHSRDAVFKTKLYRHFEDHIETGRSVADMASGLSMSKRQLTYVCKALLGVSPAKAFLQYKIEKAASILANTDMTIKETSVYLGFANQYHFSRCFKAVYGCSPTRYRKSLGK